MATKKNLRYSEGAMQKALEVVRNGMPIKTAARMYNVPKTTLYYKKIGKYPEPRHIGAPTVLTKDEEQALVTWMLHLADTGFPATKDQLLDSVKMIITKLKRHTKFTDTRPGRHWYELFLKRHPVISQRISQNLTSGRAKVSETNIRNWFHEISSYFQKNELEAAANDPRRVFNADEAAFFLSPKGPRVIARKGQKAVYSFVANDEKECITTLVCGNAAGMLPPPMVLYSFQRVPQIISRLMPSNFSLGRSESGWMTAETFFEYITNVFHPWLLKNHIVFPVILYVDGHASHLTLPLSTFCKEKHIELVALYPNSTHILQPMDVAIFHPLKNSWKNEVTKWRLHNSGQKLKRENFAPLLNNAISTLRPEMFTNGFRTCGLCPLNAEAIDYSKIKHTQILASHPTESTEERRREQDLKPILLYIESYIGKQKLSMFTSCINDSWTGETKYEEIFKLWKKVKLEIQLSRSSTPQENDEHNLVQNDLLEDNEEFSFISTDLQLLNEAKNMEDFLNQLTEDFTNEDLGEVSPVEGNTDYIPENNKVSGINEKNQSDNIKTTEKIYIEGEKTEQIEEMIGKNQETLYVSQNIRNEESEMCNKQLLQGNNEDLEKEKTSKFNKQNVIIFKPSPETTTQCKENKQRDKIKILDISVIRLPSNNNESSLTNVECKHNSQGKKNTAPENDLTDKIPSESEIMFIEGKMNVSPLNITPIDNMNVPSPFKKCLFWPDSPKTTSKNKVKEKIPTVATSDEWRMYHNKKMQEKKLKEERTEERKRKRLENIKNNNAKKLKIKAKKTETKKSENKKYKKNIETPTLTLNKSNEKNIQDLTLSQEQAESEKELSAYENNKISGAPNEIAVNDYVIVEYNSAYYPGIVREKKDNELKVSAMEASGPSLWKWPKRPDDLWYNLSDVVEIIKAPQPGHRSTFKVPEMFKLSSNFYNAD